MPVCLTDILPYGSFASWHSKSAADANAHADTNADANLGLDLGMG